MGAYGLFSVIIGNIILQALEAGFRETVLGMSRLSLQGSIYRFKKCHNVQRLT